MIEILRSEDTQVMGGSDDRDPEVRRYPSDGGRDDRDPEVRRYPSDGG